MRQRTGLALALTLAAAVSASLAGLRGPAAVATHRTVAANTPVTGQAPAARQREDVLPASVRIVYFD